jgi:hypothetical protein
MYKLGVNIVGHMNQTMGLFHNFKQIYNSLLNTDINLKQFQYTLDKKTQVSGNDNDVNIIYKTYKFKITPDNEQKELLAKHFGACRFVFNHYLNSIIIYITYCQTYFVPHFPYRLMALMP